MQIHIHIDCLDDDDVLTHLSVIRSKLKKLMAQDTDATDPDGIKFSDNNCYGVHEVEVTER